MDVNSLLLELQKRKQGYLFGGPLINWCAPDSNQLHFKSIEIDGKKYTGCKKYENCNFIGEDIKWKSWIDLSSKEQEILRDCHCYRASFADMDEYPRTLWDNNYLEQRRLVGYEWIGNPFGIRHTNSIRFLKQKLHRDLKPCQTGGCVTPEMQASYELEFSLDDRGSEKIMYWENIKACPFFYKAKDERFDTFEKNIVRFAQCYVTQQDVIDFLRRGKFISSSILFRDFFGQDGTNQFLYPFFSGYSYIQLLYRINSDAGWGKFSPQMRWHATTIQRNLTLESGGRSSNSNKIFNICDKSNGLGDKYHQQKFLDVCDGYASWLLLTWVLIKRFQAVSSREEEFYELSDIDEKFEWIYDESAILFDKLWAYGFQDAVSNSLNLLKIGTQIKRFSTFDEDLQLLGLINNRGEITDRFQFLITWLRKPITYHDKQVQDYLHNSNYSLHKIISENPNLNISELKRIFKEYVQSYFIDPKGTPRSTIDNFSEFVILNPPVHIIVRAFLGTPIRWCFIPINTDLDEKGVDVIVTSGIILLIEDSIESKAYKPEIDDSNNLFLGDLNLILPFLSNVYSIEEQNLRDEEEKKRRELEKDKEAHATRAAISQIMMRNLSHNIGSHVLSKLLNSQDIEGIFKNDAKNWQCGNESVLRKEIVPDEYKVILENVKDELEQIRLSGVSEKIQKSLQLGKQDLDNTYIYLNKLFQLTYRNYELIAIFCSYLKSRMDYLADITTSTPVIENKKSFFSEIISGFLNNKVLNDRISGIDNFKYKIIVCYPDGDQIQEECSNIELINCEKVLSARNDKSISVPNDVLGSHAFYTILENIIRNAAKHAYSNKDTQFVIKIEEAVNFVIDIGNMQVINELNELYSISIFDKSLISPERRVILIDEDRTLFTADQLDKIDAMKGLQALVFEQNNRLNKSILKNGRKRHGAWGLIEMDASAAYLRKILIEQIDSDDYQIDIFNDKSIISNTNKINILKAYSEQNMYLGYRFFVFKPREILIIGNDLDILEPEITNRVDFKKSLRKHGIWIIDSILDNCTYPHKIIFILDSEVFNNFRFKPGITRRICNKLPRKINYNDLSKISNILNLIDLFISEYYIENNYPYYKDVLFKSRLKAIGAINFDNLEISEAMAKEINHGGGVCKYLEYDFIEISTSATSQFFGLSDVVLRTFSWPLEILVIDERIQSLSQSGTYPVARTEACEENCLCSKGITYSKLYEKTNIRVPTEKEANLNLRSFEDYDEFQNIINYIKQYMLQAEFIVIHLGVIEKLIAPFNRFYNFKYDKEIAIDLRDFLIDQICNKDKSIYDRIVVTSGRGVPHNLPKDIRYLNFSIISQYLVDLRNKFALTEALFSARNMIQTD